MSKRHGAYVSLKSLSTIVNANQIVVLEDDRVVEKGTHEALLAQGVVAGGYVFYVQDNELHYLQNYLDLEAFTVTSCVDVPEGECTLRYAFDPKGPSDPRNGKGTSGCIAQLVRALNSYPCGAIKSIAVGSSPIAPTQFRLTSLI